MPIAPTPLPPHSADADAFQHLADGIAGADRPSRLAEEHGQERRHAGVHHAIGEAHDEWMQPRHLVDDDDARALALAIDRARPTAVAEVELRVGFQNLVHFCPFVSSRRQTNMRCHPPGQRQCARRT